MEVFGSDIDFTCFRLVSLCLKVFNDSNVVLITSD